MIEDHFPKEIGERALEIWREREMQFEPRIRRMKPDEIDRASGAWLSCVIAAAKEKAQCR